MGEVHLVAFPLLVLMVEVWLALVAIAAQESAYGCYVWVGMPSVWCIWEQLILATDTLVLDIELADQWDHLILSW